MSFLLSNEILLFVQIIVSFLGVVLMYRLFGKVGMFVAAGAVTLFANLEVANQCDFFGLAVSLGNVSFVALNLIQDTLNENEGEKVAKHTVWFGFATCFLIFVISQISILFTPNEFDEAHGAFSQVFNQFSTVTFISLGTYLLSNMVNVKLYAAFSKVTNKVWMRSQASTWISQFVDTVVMTVALCIFGIFPWETLIELIVTTYIIKGIVAVCEVPFAYWTKHLKTRGLVREVL